MSRDAPAMLRSLELTEQVCGSRPRGTCVRHRSRVLVASEGHTHPDLDRSSDPIQGPPELRGPVREQEADLILALEKGSEAYWQDRSLIHEGFDDALMRPQRVLVRDQAEVLVLARDCCDSRGADRLERRLAMARGVQAGLPVRDGVETEHRSTSGNPRGRCHERLARTPSRVPSPPQSSPGRAAR